MANGALSSFENEEVIRADGDQPPRIECPEFGSVEWFKSVSARVCGSCQDGSRLCWLRSFAPYAANPCSVVLSSVIDING